MKILNLHGFLGEADNKNYKALCGLLPAEIIISPQLDYKNSAPRAILDALSAQVNEDDLIFVGQSLGGWYADQLSRRYHRPCILTNPCYFPHDLEMIVKSGIPAEFVDQYRDLSAQNQNVQAFVLCSDADTVIPDNYANCIALAHTVRRVSGSHSTISDLQVHLSEMLAATESGHSADKGE